MADIAWGNMIMGTIFIACGMAFVASRTFGEIALAYTSQGVMWKKLLGEKWAPVVVKYLFSLVSIAAGVWVIRRNLRVRLTYDRPRVAGTKPPSYPLEPPNRLPCASDPLGGALNLHRRLQQGKRMNYAAHSCCNLAKCPGAN
jgi:hypothetical protein